MERKGKKKRKKERQKDSKKKEKSMTKKEGKKKEGIRSKTQKPKHYGVELRLTASIRITVNPTFSNVFFFFASVE